MPGFPGDGPPHKFLHPYTALSSAASNAIPCDYTLPRKKERGLVAGYNLGANSYIQKPVDFDQFRETVKNVGLVLPGYESGGPGQWGTRFSNAALSAVVWACPPTFLVESRRALLDRPDEGTRGYVGMAIPFPLTKLIEIVYGIVVRPEGFQGLSVEYSWQLRALIRLQDNFLNRSKRLPMHRLRES